MPCQNNVFLLRKIARLTQEEYVTTLHALKGLLNLIWNILFLSELAQVLFDRWPACRPYLPPGMLLKMPPKRVNGLGMFLRHAPGASALRKLQELVLRFNGPLSYLMQSIASRYFLTGTWMWMRHGRRAFWPPKACWWAAMIWTVPL